jgi:D-alanine-D-alanine ligase
VMNSLGISTPPFGLAKTLEQAQILTKNIGFPVSVKPVAEGSSIGVTRVASLEALPHSFAKAQFYGDVIIEKWIDGKDFFVSILDTEVLPSVEVHVPGQFYDFEAKYESNQTQYLCPSPHSQEKEMELRDLAYRAYCALGCEGCGRVDLVQDVNAEFWVLEVNTIPGMTSHSLVPMSAKAVGIEFDELVLRILAMTLPAVSKDEKRMSWIE